MEFIYLLVAFLLTIVQQSVLVCCEDPKFTDHKFTAVSVVNIFYEKMYFGLKGNDLVLSRGH